MDVIKCKAIIEMLGGPKEHIKQVLVDFVEKKVKTDDGYTVVSSKYAEPIEQGKLFSTYVELDLEFPTPGGLMGFCEDALPSSVEVYEPNHFSLNMQDLNGMLNDLCARLHRTDMIVKDLRSQNSLLNKNSINLLRNFIKFIVNGGDNTLEKISVKIGIDERELKPFLNRMIEDNQLVLDGGVYAVP